MQKKYLLPKGDQFDKDQILTDRCYFRTRFLFFTNPFYMKLKSTLIVLLIPVAFACRKDKGPCYDCTAISAGTTYNEVVCTTGQPEDKLPDHDANGQLGWNCIQRP